jgi:hypothetical protein
MVFFLAFGTGGRQQYVLCLCGCSYRVRNLIEVRLFEKTVIFQHLSFAD